MPRRPAGSRPGSALRTVCSPPASLGSDTGVRAKVSSKSQSLPQVPRPAQQAARFAAHGSTEHAAVTVSLTVNIR